MSVHGMELAVGYDERQPVVILLDTSASMGRPAYFELSFATGPKILPGIHYAPLPDDVAARVRQVIGTLS
jgi:hypothetical protein